MCVVGLSKTQFSSRYDKKLTNIPEISARMAYQHNSKNKVRMFKVGEAVSLRIPQIDRISSALKWKWEDKPSSCTGWGIPVIYSGVESIRCLLGIGFLIHGCELQMLKSCYPFGKLEDRGTLPLGPMDGEKFDSCLSEKQPSWVLCGMPLLTIFTSAPLGAAHVNVTGTSWVSVAVVTAMEVSHATTRVMTRRMYGDTWRMCNLACFKAYTCMYHTISKVTVCKDVTQPLYHWLM